MKRRRLPTSTGLKTQSKQCLPIKTSLLDVNINKEFDQSLSWSPTTFSFSHLLPFVDFQFPAQDPIGYIFGHVLGHLLRLERGHQLPEHHHQPHLVRGYQLGNVQLLHNAYNQPYSKRPFRHEIFSISEHFPSIRLSIISNVSSRNLCNVESASSNLLQSFIILKRIRL